MNRHNAQPWPFPTPSRSCSHTMAQARALLALEREIATEHAITVLEVYAATVPSDYPHPLYDVAQLEPEQIATEPDMDAARATLARAVRYLDMRELLVRPIAGQPQFVAFQQEAL